MVEKLKKHSLSPLAEDGLSQANEEDAQEILSTLSGQDCGILKPQASPDRAVRQLERQFIGVNPNRKPGNM